MHASILRRRHISKLRELQAYSPIAAWSVFAFTCFQVLTLFAAGAGVLRLELHWAFATMIVVGIQFLIATRLRALNNIVHECSHASFSRDRSTNNTIGKLAASFILGSFREYKSEHLTHHAHLGNYERDEDLKRIEPLGIHEKLSTRVIIRHLVTPLVGRHLPYYLSVNVDSSDGRAYQILKISLVFLAISYSYIEPVVGALLIILPYAYFFTALNYWADCIDHAGLVSESDDLAASRNVIVPRVVSWIFFPRNDCYHLVHHLFPTVPAAHLHRAHEMLLDDDVYARRRNAVGSLGAKPALAQAWNLAQEKSE